MFPPDQKLFDAAREAGHTVPTISVPTVKRVGPWDRAPEVIEAPTKPAQKIKPLLFKVGRGVLRETVFTGRKRLRYAPKTIWRSAGLLMAALVGSYEYVDANYGARSDMAVSASCSVTTKNEAGKQLTVTYKDSGWLSTVYSTYNACRNAVLDTNAENFVSLNIRQAWGMRGLEGFLEGEKLAAFGGENTMADRSKALEDITFMREEGPAAYLGSVGRALSLEYVTYHARQKTSDTANWFGSQFESAQHSVAVSWNNALDRMKTAPAAPKP